MVIQIPTLIIIEFSKDTIFKETADLSQAMWWELLDVTVVSILGIISTHCNYLVILLSLIHGINQYQQIC